MNHIFVHKLEFPKYQVWGADTLLTEANIFHKTSREKKITHFHVTVLKCIEKKGQDLLFHSTYNNTITSRDSRVLKVQVFQNGPCPSK